MASEQATEWGGVIVHGLFRLIVGGVIVLVMGLIIEDAWWVPAIALGLIVGLASAVWGDRF